MLKFFVSSILCASFFVVKAKGWEPDSLVNPKLIIKTPILSYIDIFGGLSYRLGTEFNIYKNITGGVEFGKYFSYQSENRKGGILRAEIKLYRNNKKRAGDFFSVEYLYKNTTFNFVDSFAVPAKPRYQKEYEIHKEISCLTLKWGNLSVYKKRFVYEWYLGVGVRYYSRAYNNLTNEENEHILVGEGHGDLVGHAIRLVGKRFTPNLNAGIKIGYLLY